MVLTALFLVFCVVSGQEDVSEEAAVFSNDFYCLYGDLVVPAGFKVEEDTCGGCFCPNNPVKNKATVTCPSCASCDYRGEDKRHLAVWWNGCTKCQCLDSTIVCKNRDCPKMCLYKDTTYFEDEEWMDECNKCVCVRERALCSRKECTCMEGGVKVRHGTVGLVPGKGSCLCLDAELNCSMFGFLEQFLGDSQ